MARNYKREYRLFQSKPKDIIERVKRNRNRRKAEREGRVRKGDNKDVHHNGSRTRVLHRSVNRGMNSRNSSSTQGDRNARG
jgi:hypothetical protein